ncbi:HAMP domain-containing protein [Cellulosimicrobium cellulans]|uniref:HAMP domain-containing protein n=1 Tax=Cellulosimicrobium cellulans TaxID=1710 RepID=UPI000B0274D8|nr:HAMP domain-containing protein [Cellulosimicrobium cellulans]
MRPSPWSLRARLTALASLVLAAALVVGALALSAVVSGGRVAALDDIARERALLVARLAASDQVPDVLPVSEPGEVVQLLGPAGEVLASSATASRTLPVLPVDELATLRAEAVAADGVRVAGTERGAYDAAARVAVAPVAGTGGTTAVATVPLREVEGVVRALRVSLAVVVPLLTLVAAGVIWSVLGRALSPVEDLRRGAEAVARSGGPGVLPVPRTDDELGALARTLNAMLDSLQAAAARQRSFVADAAHELRSPVAALRASIEVARLHPAAYPATSSPWSSRARYGACRRSSTTSSSSRGSARGPSSTRTSTSVRWRARSSPCPRSGRRSTGALPSR